MIILHLRRQVLLIYESYSDLANEIHPLDSTAFDCDIEAGLMPSSDHKIARGHSPPLDAQTTRVHTTASKERLDLEAVSAQPVQATNLSWAAMLQELAMEATLPKL